MGEKPEEVYQQVYRVWENEPEYDERTDIEPEWDEDGEEWFKIIDNRPKEPTYVFDKSYFAYPSMIAQNTMYAEDVSEAIIQQLVRAGAGTYDDLAQCHFEFEDPETGKFITLQVLKIKWR